MLADLIICAAVAVVSSFIAGGVLIGAGIVDMPTEPRKAHRAPTPTSGGIGIALGFAIGLMALSLFSMVWRHEITAYGAAMSSIGAAFAFGFLILGFVDDARPLGPRLKFIAFGALSVFAALGVGLVRELPFGAGAVVQLGFAAALIGTALWVFTLVNCVNFMDGANGLAMGSVAIGLTGLAVIGVSLHALSGAAIAICGAGALLGFLFWNFPNGRLFAGDSGALFAGAIAALAALVIIARGGMSPFIAPILFFPLLGDALLTLAWRARRGRSLLDGHSEHLYQIAQRFGWSIPCVALAYWAAMAVCGAIAIGVARAPDTPAAPIALGALAIAALIVSALVRAAALRRGVAEA